MIVIVYKKGMISIWTFELAKKLPGNKNKLGLCACDLFDLPNPLYKKGLEG